jgi:uncharacterized protein (DUF362 family)
MVKGVSVKFTSYEETVPKFLNLIKFNEEIKKHKTIILKPFLDKPENSTPIPFAEAILKYCLANKDQEAQVFIADGADGISTMELFDQLGYTNLSEKYSNQVGLIDLNEAEVFEVESTLFKQFDKILFPKILSDSFIITIPKLAEHQEFEFAGSMASMLGAFPGKYYKGFFSSKKNKIRKWPIRYSIHDIIRCKAPEFSILDASEKGRLIAGQPLEVDKQAVALLGKSWRDVSHLRLLDETLSIREEKNKMEDILPADEQSPQ